MAGKQFIVNGMVFPTKTALTKHIQGILHSYPLHTNLHEHDLLFLSDLIDRYHPEAELKVGCGVKTMCVKKSEYNSKGFHLERLDGTTTDFSFMKCLSPPTPWQEFLKASREAIRPDTEAFRSAAFSNGVIRCPYLDIVLTPGTCHVDHKPPKTFATLLNEFIETTSLDWRSLKIKPTEDNNQLTEFEDQNHIDTWRDWHRINCDLRVVSRLANLSHVKKEANGTV